MTYWSTASLTAAGERSCMRSCIPTAHLDERVRAGSAGDGAGAKLHLGAALTGVGDQLAEELTELHRVDLDLCVRIEPAGEDRLVGDRGSEQLERFAQEHAQLGSFDVHRRICIVSALRPPAPSNEGTMT